MRCLARDSAAVNQASRTTAGCHYSPVIEEVGSLGARDVVVGLGQGLNEMRRHSEPHRCVDSLLGMMGSQELMSYKLAGRFLSATVVT